MYLKIYVLSGLINIHDINKSLLITEFFRQDHYRYVCGIQGMKQLTGTKVLLYTQIIVFGLSFLFFHLRAFGQENTATSDLVHHAEKALRTNKNAVALELFEQEGKQLEKSEQIRRDSLKKVLDSDFNKAADSRKVRIAELNRQIADLEATTEDISRENYKLIRSSLLFFGILVGLLVLLLLNRFKVLAGLKEQLLLSNRQIESMQGTLLSKEKHESERKEWSHFFSLFTDAVTPALPALEKIRKNKQHKFFRSAESFRKQLEITRHLFVSGQLKEFESKTAVDLNLLIEEASSIVQAYYSSSETEIKIKLNRDLEQILPKVELIPGLISLVIFHVVENAFYAVTEKSRTAPKGFEPTVSISTRKLPRFVQIRIKDNGVGIATKAGENIFESFYSTKNSPLHIGLGLSESRKIINNIHKGELFLDSDFTTGTDFVIRFPFQRTV